VCHTIAVGIAEFVIPQRWVKTSIEQSVGVWLMEVDLYINLQNPDKEFQHDIRDRKIVINSHIKYYFMYNTYNNKQECFISVISLK